MKLTLLVRLLAWATLLALPAGILAWVRGPAATWARAPVTPLERAHLELGLACLAEGELQPALAELADADLVVLAGLVGRLLHAYQEGAFESFLALRLPDLEHAAEVRAGDAWQVQGFVRELGGELENLERCGWVESLRRYWAAYYAHPPVARFLPERTVARLHREGLGARSLADWERSFEALRERAGGASIQHELVIPHRREIERVARDAGPLQWLDLELAFETRCGAAGRLLARFVWDAVLREWFLQAATTVYEQGARVERHLIL
ncbi:MAG TPA: hypothetical protein VF530_14125 [Planctomycetota bacterium]